MTWAALNSGNSELALLNSDTPRHLSEPLRIPIDDRQDPEGVVAQWSADRPGMDRAIRRALTQGRPESFRWDVGSFHFQLDERVLIMGIVNVTPDSFFDGGRNLDHETALRHAMVMVEQGADIIDIGGESTRPSAAPVSEEEELRRILGIVEELAARDILVSIDTYHPRVARSAVDAGAQIINDVSGFRNREMVDVLANCAVAGVIMHMRGEPRTMQVRPSYTWATGEIALFLAESLESLNAAGIEEKRLVIDPGIGFGKLPAHNLELLRELRSLGGLGRPILVGVSRKSFIGDILDLPVEERLEGSLAAAAAAVMNGARIVRVHDVKPTVRLIRVLEKICFPRAVEEVF